MDGSPARARPAFDSTARQAGGQTDRRTKAPFLRRKNLAHLAKEGFLHYLYCCIYFLWFGLALRMTASGNCETLRCETGERLSSSPQPCYLDATDGERGRKPLLLLGASSLIRYRPTRLTSRLKYGTFCAVTAVFLFRILFPLSVEAFVLLLSDEPLL